MSQIILHHYPMSPFSEKVRVVLGFKRLAWRAVEQPMWNPKPKLVALTGGYRRIPVMQIGADVYCDTACIVRALEARHPQPALLPAAQAGSAQILASWADHAFFTAAAGLVLAGIGRTLPPEFKADRERMVPGLKIDQLPGQAPHLKSQIRAACEMLDRQLGASPFLLGTDFTLADAACFHVLWFLRMEPAAAAIAAAFPHLDRWYRRVEAFGHGDGSPLDADEALAVAATSTSPTAEAVDPGDPSGARPGDRVTVTPDDYACDPVAGELVSLGISDVAIRRRDPTAGDVVVHFPRAGFRVAAA
jgi:glutathione S-transferase